MHAANTCRVLSCCRSAPQQNLASAPVQQPLPCSPSLSICVSAMRRNTSRALWLRLASTTVALCLLHCSLRPTSSEGMAARDGECTGGASSRQRREAGSGTRSTACRWRAAANAAEVVLRNASEALLQASEQCNTEHCRCTAREARKPHIVDMLCGNNHAPHLRSPLPAGRAHSWSRCTSPNQSGCASAGAAGAPAGSGPAMRGGLLPKARCMPALHACWSPQHAPLVVQAASASQTSFQHTSCPPAGPTAALHWRGPRWPPGGSWVAPPAQTAAAVPPARADLRPHQKVEGEKELVWQMVSKAQIVAAAPPARAAVPQHGGRR